MKEKFIGLKNITHSKIPLIIIKHLVGRVCLGKQIHFMVKNTLWNLNKKCLRNTRVKNYLKNILKRFPRQKKVRITQDMARKFQKKHV